MAEIHQKYNLKPRNRNIITTPVNKILPRVEKDEATSKDAKKQTVKIKIANTQSTKTKEAETPVVSTRTMKIPIVQTKIAETKATQISKS